MSAVSSSPPRVRAVLRAPQVSRVLLASQIGRLPLASGPLALLLFARQSLSLTAAGLLVAAYTAAMAVSAPLLARTVDRWRQPPVLWASALVSGAGFALVAAGGHRLPTAAAGAALAGLGTPPLEACLRALWPDLLAPDVVPAAYALDIAVQEVIFVAGPLTTVAAVALGGPAAGLLTAAVLQLAGTAVFAMTPAVRSWRGVRAVRHWAGPLRSHRLALMLAGVLCVGLAFGSIPVALTGYAEAAGTRSLSGWLLAAQATGALAGGLIYTRARPGGPIRLPVLAAALTAGFLPLLLTPRPVLMAVLLALSGLALPPLLTAVFLAADRLAPAGTVAEAFAWVATAFAVGSAIGSAATGPLVAAGVRWGFALAPLAALVCVTVLTVVARSGSAPARAAAA
ncbi:MFS transporter [Actinoplanes auranticolor]|uniref:MFS transporter n=1 Tax=Actinoplanes auranticolor TaxID=47988 RepID=A0A919SCI0_9ACTN|nr:MFS transporter [Actinoplanes auranticolor]GIM69321.1 MFS transporter [Actinoplanes auranticolor]